MLNLIARRDGSDFVLFCNGREFGRLANCEVCYVYEGFAAEEINKGMEGDFSAREMLAHVRSKLNEVVKNKTGAFSPEQYAAEGMRRRAVGEALNIPSLIKDANSVVTQACAAMRSRGLNYYGG